MSTYFPFASMSALTIQVLLYFGSFVSPSLQLHMHGIYTYIHLHNMITYCIYLPYSVNAIYLQVAAVTPAGMGNASNVQILDCVVPMGMD